MSRIRATRAADGETSVALGHFCEKLTLDGHPPVWGWHPGGFAHARPEGSMAMGVKYRDVCTPIDDGPRVVRTGERARRTTGRPTNTGADLEFPVARPPAPEQVRGLVARSSLEGGTSR